MSKVTQIYIRLLRKQVLTSNRGDIIIIYPNEFNGKIRSFFYEGVCHISYCDYFGEVPEGDYLQYDSIKEMELAIISEKLDCIDLIRKSKYVIYLDDGILELHNLERADL